MLKKLQMRRPIDPCLPFQIDLSSMVDEEIDERSVSRTLVHLETCSGCREFLQSVRGGVVVHRQLADPARLERVLQMLEATRVFPVADTKSHLRRLAAIYFQLGKAYLMFSLDKKFQCRLLDEPVTIPDYKVRGRHFVEKVLHARSGEGIFRGYDWVKARYLLNGRLENDADNLEKGKLLLDESLVVRPRFAEPRLFLALYHRALGQEAQSVEHLEWVLANGQKTFTRASAAVQLGVLHGVKEEFHKALEYSHWVLRQQFEDSGEAKHAFFVASYNTAIYYAQMGDFERSIEYFRALVAKQPERANDAGMLLRDCPIMRKIVAESAGFRQKLESVSPSLVLAGN